LALVIKLKGGGGGHFTCSNEDYLPLRRLEKGEGESAPCALQS
jgi:hypothetical protein